MNLLSIGEVAKRLGYSRSTVRNLCDRGLLPYIRPTGQTGHRRIMEKDLEAFLASVRGGVV